MFVTDVGREICPSNLLLEPAVTARYMLIRLSRLMNLWLHNIAAIKMNSLTIQTWANDLIYFALEFVLTSAFYQYYQNQCLYN